MPHYEGWTVTVTYEDGESRTFYTGTVETFSRDMAEFIKIGHGDIISIVMV